MLAELAGAGVLDVSAFFDDPLPSALDDDFSVDVFSDDTLSDDDLSEDALSEDDLLSVL